MVKFVTTELFFKSSVTRKLKMLHFSGSSILLISLPGPSCSDFAG